MVTAVFTDPAKWSFKKKKKKADSAYKEGQTYTIFSASRAHVFTLSLAVRGHPSVSATALPPTDPSLLLFSVRVSFGNFPLEKWLNVGGAKLHGKAEAAFLGSHQGRNDRSLARSF